jgi:O-antigen/teichoic acid export membrane protein
MSLKKQALSGVFWSSLQLFGTQGIGLVVSIILARLLLPSEFGLIAMLGLFMGLAAILINSGLTSSLIRSENLDEEDYSTVFYFNLAVSCLLYVVFLLVAPLLASFYNQPVLTAVIRVYSITFIINAFSAIQITRLNKNMDFKTQLQVSIPSLVVGCSVGIAMAYYGFGVWSLVWSAIIQALVSTIQLWYMSKWMPLWVFNIEKFKYHFHYGIKLMFSGILDIFFTNAYTIIIGKFFAPAQVGYYNRAESLQMFPVSAINSVIGKVTFPLFATIQNDEVRLKIVYKKIMQMVLFLVTPTLVLMAVLAEPLFRFLLTEKWLPAVPYFQILCFNGILYPIHSYNLQILIVKGRSDLFLKLEIVKKILIVVIILISFQFGIYGLLYGSAIGSVLCFFINTHYSGRFLKYTAWEQTKDIFPILVVSGLAGSVVFVADLVLKNYYYIDFFRLAFGGILGIVLFTTVAFVCKLGSLFELIAIAQRK